MPIKILIADDSATDRLIIKNMLSDYCVLTACDGVDAIRILEDHDDINLLILDINMPNMNGFQVLEFLRENERYSKLRTIILTVYDELDNEIRGLRLGAVDYIRKPIQMASLRARIDVHVALLHAEAALKQQLDDQALTFDMLFEQAPIGIAISYSCDPDFPDNVNVRINSKFEQIIGRTKEELIRLGWAKITHPDDLEEDIKNFMRLQSGEIKMYSMDKRFIRPDGSIIWVHMIVAPLALSDDQQYSHICLIQDITERKAIEEALNESERSKSVLLSHLPGLAYRCNYDRDWTMQYVSKGCFNLTGYPPESLLYNRDLSYNDIISPEYREALWNEWERVLASRKPFRYEYEIITATGEKKWVFEAGQGIFNDNGEVEALEGIVLDISDRKAVEDALKYNNEHDRWTGLYNRDFLMLLLEKDTELRKKSKKAFIGINISMVQLLTAKYGFQYSQNLIKKAAEALSQHSTESRLLFQECENRFIFYLPDYKDKNELVEFGAVIADTLRSLFVTERIGGGIGILEIEQNQSEVDIDLLLRRLLIASERSVSMFGKDFEICFYNEELEAIVNRERDIVEALSAIAADDYTNDDLFLQYQPIMNLRTGSICGFEALARLRTEKLGIVSPLEFIPIAEKTKLILPIGEKVFVKAFSFLKKLKELGYDGISVSINTSVIQLLSPDFTSKLFELINDMQVTPNNIFIEITESVFASDYNIINKIIKKLRSAGLQIVIDDFGTGYSSLSREKELIVDCMKIDKYFIDNLLSADLSKAITGDIISIAHKLEQYTIAEGVEHDIQLQYLKEHNCDRIQGYLISKPLDEDEAVKFLKNKEAWNGND
ncbi:MAG TPA: EAL domain-containing protein [Clostridiales bacterium]|nr:EAL domain-containing protein [Clostridiales bacterium]